MRELVLVRHGETVGQSSIRLYGATDVALAPEGEAQVRAAGRALAGQRFDAVFTSPLRRAHRSAELVLAAIEHPKIEIEIVEAFREIDFGAWEGWTWAEVKARDPEGHARWTEAAPGFRFPDGEAREAFIARVQASVGPSIEARFSAGATRILAVVHKGVIRATAARLLGLPFAELELELPLGALLRLRGDAEGWTLS
ncbi:Phosphoserine phosphatase 1 [Enhygromyxa salina]|uniref:phosphoglycerate mutase (2,3-diphosphoglycerate-dependent) n=1 Tax=Enhygromyxa salina TaxID=215803 RepID=A0A2S9YGL4_9BACT|nr:histidine phosphatase family protein [Enhygromyxa salina]PRQ04253.1 Phosphoserine phosphatase 1 [Enhygromyxa salina]